MAFTVTVTQGGTTQSGMALSVIVLTGATEAGGANLQAQPIPGAAQGTVTPAFSGSLIYWAIANGSVNAAWTLNGSNSFGGTGLGDFADGTDVYRGTTGAYTGTVTAASGVTVGASAPTANNTAIAAYEIPKNGTIAVDASTPVQKTATATSVASNAFTPPGGAVLVALAANNGSGAALETVTISDTSGLGLIWTRRAISNSAGTTDSLAAIWTATMPGGAAATPPRVSFRQYAPAWRPGLPGMPGGTPFTRWQPAGPVPAPPPPPPPLFTITSDAVPGLMRPGFATPGNPVASGATPAAITTPSPSYPPGYYPGHPGPPGGIPFCAPHSDALAAVTAAPPPSLPQFLDQPGSRPRCGPRVPRGQFFSPAPGQGNQGVPFPLFLQQAQRKRLTLRRSEGQFFSPGQFSNAAPQLPSFPRQASARRIVTAVRPARGQFFSPGWGQANQGVRFPLSLRQAGNSARWTLRRSHGTFFSQSWGQANQGAQFPLYERQAQSSRLTLRRSQGRFFSPGQFNLDGNPWPSFTRQAQTQRLIAAARKAHGTFFSPGWGQANQGTPFPLYGHQPGNASRWTLRNPRGRFFGVATPAATPPPPPFITRQERAAPARISRGKFQSPGLGQGNQGVPFPLRERQSGYSPKWAPRISRGRWFNPGWGQGNQGSAFPLYLRQGQLSREALRRSHGQFYGVPQGLVAPVIPQIARKAGGDRRAIRFPRGQFYGQVWPQGNQGTVFPLFARQDSRRLVRPPRGRFFSPGQFNLDGNSYPSFTRATSRLVPERVSRSRFFNPGQYNLSASQVPQFTRQPKRNLTSARHGTYFQVSALRIPGIVPTWVSPHRPKLSPPQRGKFTGIPKPAIIPVFPPEFKTTRRVNFTRLDKARRGTIIQLVPFQQPSVTAPEINLKLGVPGFAWTTGGPKKVWRVP